MEVKGVAAKNVNLSFSAGALKNGGRLTPASWLSFGERVAINRVNFSAVSTDRVGHIKSRRHSTVAGAAKAWRGCNGTNQSNITYCVRAVYVR